MTDTGVGAGTTSQFSEQTQPREERREPGAGGVQPWEPWVGAGWGRSPLIAAEPGEGAGSEVEGRIGPQSSRSRGWHPEFLLAGVSRAFATWGRDLTRFAPQEDQCGFWEEGASGGSWRAVWGGASESVCKTTCKNNQG